MNNNIIKKFIDVYVPIFDCNLKCPYCYISTWSEWDKEKQRDKKIKYDASYIRKALSMNRWGGPLMLNFCAAGETLISKEIIDIIRELLDEGHYCMIVTNGTIDEAFKKICDFNKEQRDRLFIKFSYHYLELKRLNLLDRFFNNVLLMKNNDISFTVELTPSDIYIPYVDELTQLCVEKVGAKPHLTVCREENGKVPIMSKLSREEYIKQWKNFDSELFNYKMRIFNEKRHEFCYAGAWSYTLSLVTGDLKQCYRGKTIQNIFDDLESDIIEKPVGKYCSDPHCWNGHAFLTFGDIPELESPYFSEVRNRKCVDGSEWLKPNMKEFMSHKLNENNKQYSKIKKLFFNFEQSAYVTKEKAKNKIKRIYRRMSKKERD